MTTGSLNLSDVERFRGIVAARFGLQFEDSKLGFLAEVLRKRLQEGSEPSICYLDRLEADPQIEAESAALARELTINETYFFRNISQFQAFSEIVLPERITRAEFMAKMLEHKIAVGYHYAPIHLFTLYRERGFKEGMFPITERVGKQIVTLPMFYALTKNEVEHTVAAVKSILQ